MKTIKQFWLKFYEKFTPKSLKHTSRIWDTSLNGWSQAVKTNCKQALPNLNILASSINRTMGRLTKPQSPSTTEFLNPFFRNISQPHYHPTSPKWNKRKPLLIPNLTPMYFDQLLHCPFHHFIRGQMFLHKVLEPVVPFHLSPNYLSFTIKFIRPSKLIKSL